MPESSFAGIPFDGVVVSSGFCAAWERGLVWSSRHIAFSDASDIQVAGMDTWKLETQIILYDPDAYRVFVALMDGQLHNLVWDGGAYNAALVKVSNARLASSGGVAKLMVMSVQFIRTD